MGCRIQVSGFRVSGLEFRVQGAGWMVQTEIIQSRTAGARGD